MAKTTNYELEKPEVTDFYDIGVFNGNMDVIDEELKTISMSTAEKTKKAVIGTATLKSTGWSKLESPIGEYTKVYALNLMNITSTHIFNGTVALASEEAAQDCGLAQYCETIENKVMFYAKDQPSADITIQYNYIEGV